MLPVAAWIDEEGEPSRVVGLEPGHPEVRVLVVDDVWENRVLLVKLLTLVGIDAREAANGREAVDIWQSWQPHLIWMDMRMPVMNGYDATKEIRKLERLARSMESVDGNVWPVDGEPPSSDTPTDDRASNGGRCVIVALTASAFEHDRDEILAAGCDDFVAKPFREGTIFERLSQHIGVRFSLEVPVPADFTASRLDRLAGPIPPEFVSELSDAVTAGDLEVSLRVIDRIAVKDAALAGELRTLIKSYRIDEILERIEREAGKAEPGE
jgi:CheY-like chemotaxis protein